MILGRLHDRPLARAANVSTTRIARGRRLRRTANRRSLAPFAAAVLAVLTVSSASAAPVYVAGVACNGPFQSNEGAGAVSNACSFSTPGNFVPSQEDALSAHGASSAGPGFLRMDSLTQVFFAAQSGTDIVAAQAWGEWFYDDFVIVGPGSDTTPVLGALNLHVGGFLFADVLNDAAGPLRTTGGANAQFFFQIDLDGNNAGFGEVIRRSTDGVLVETVDGLLVGHYGSGERLSDVITSTELVLPVGTAFSVHVYANAGANSSARVFGSPADEFDFAPHHGGARSDFSATVRFPSTGPVFELPPGYTIHSVSAGIVNNRITPAVVPEPSSLLLLAVAALSWLGCRTRGCFEGIRRRRWSRTAS